MFLSIKDHPEQLSVIIGPFRSDQQFEEIVGFGDGPNIMSDDIPVPLLKYL